MKRIYFIIGILLVLALVLVGCSTEEPEVKGIDSQERSQSEIDTVKSEDPIASEQEESEEKEEEESEPKESETEVGKDTDPEIFSGKLIEMMKGKHYTMKMNTVVTMEGKQFEVQTTTVVNGNESATTMKADKLYMTTILKDGKAYIIMHDQKMILVAPIPEPEELEIGLEEIDFSKIEYIGKGKGMFLGNERNYEEYKVDLGIVRYYFDGKELDGMEIIADEGSTIMDVEFYSEDVDLSVFELPKGYMTIGN